MATLLVRKLESELVERLKRQAATHGRSAEAEHREILRAALSPRLTGKELFEALRRGEPFAADVEPDDWRAVDHGDPAEL